MVLYKFKKPKQAEYKPKTEPRKTPSSKESEDSSYHYDYMKQLMKQKNGAKTSASSLETPKKKRNKTRFHIETEYDLEPFVEMATVLVVFVCILIAAGVFLTKIDSSDIDNTKAEQTATVESHSEVVSEYSSFDGMQENGLPKKWIATVNKDHKYIDFSDLAKEYEYRDITRSLSFTVTEGDECIVDSIYDVGFETSWPAYDLCNDSNTKTYNLTVHVSDSDEIGTVQLVLTVEK